VINPDSIPQELRALIPLVDRWSFSDDEERLARLTTASAEERTQFLGIMKVYHEPLTKWLQSIDVTKSEDAMAISWLDTAAAELEAIELRQSRSVLRQVVVALIVLGVCLAIGVLIGFVYFRVRR
jgi:hypothetical protein